MFRALVFAIIFCAQSLAVANSDSPAPSADAGRGRLMELFIWKISEELKLPAETEGKFGEKVRALNEKRRLNGERLERAIKKLDEATKAPAVAAAKQNKIVETALTEYRNTVKELHQIQTDEIGQLRAILGSEKFGRYLVVKNEITEKLKSFLSRPDQPGTPTVKDSKMEVPKVIEEK